MSSSTIDTSTNSLPGHPKRVDVRQIARRLQISRGTVYRSLRMQQPPTRAPCPVPTALPLDTYTPSLLRRWNEGCRNAKQLWRELVAQGYAQSRSTIARFVGLLHILRVETGQRRRYASAAPAPLYDDQRAREETVRPLTTRQAARLLLTVEDRRTTAEQARVSRLLRADPEIAQTYEHVQAFARLVRERRGGDFDAWEIRVRRDGCRELQHFVIGLLSPSLATLSPAQFSQEATPQACTSGTRS